MKTETFENYCNKCDKKKKEEGMYSEGLCIKCYKMTLPKRNCRICYRIVPQDRYFYCKDCMGAADMTDDFDDLRRSMNERIERQSNLRSRNRSLQMAKGN